VTRRITFAVALGSGRIPLDQDPGPQALNLHQAGRPPQAAMLPVAPAPDQMANPVPADRVVMALGNTLPKDTLATVHEAPLPLQAGLVLGSPDFMRC
jgi:hypothetical protein